MDDRIIQIVDGNTMTFRQLKALEQIINEVNFHWVQADVYSSVIVLSLASGLKMKYKISDSGDNIKLDNRIVI